MSVKNCSTSAAGPRWSPADRAAWACRWPRRSGEMGARVALTARKRDELDQAVAHLHKRWASTPSPWRATCPTPRRSRRSVERAIAALGPIDILVNNAGTTWGAATVEHPLEAWQKVIDLNLTAMFVVSQEVGRRCMVPRRKRQDHQHRVDPRAGRRRRSRATRRPSPTTPARAASINFTRSLAAEWAQYNINVNAIAPGFFPTKMTKGIMEMLGDEVADQGAAQARRRARGPQGARRAVRVGCLRVHHRPDRRRRRRRHGRLNDGASWTSKPISVASSRSRAISAFGWSAKAAARRAWSSTCVRN